jgi:acetyltransferase-like isoleucine patch superfamily enzyme
MSLLSALYRLRHPGATKIPKAYQRSLLGLIWHGIRKFICQNIAPNCITNVMRVNLYRLCGFKIGKHVFIGMKCYMDDIDPKMTIIGNDVVISYGVSFSCHGRRQIHHIIEIQDGAYLGMNCAVLAHQDLVIGKGAVVGAMALVNKSVMPGKTVVGIPCHEI